MRTTLPNALQLLLYKDVHLKTFILRTRIYSSLPFSAGAAAATSNDTSRGRAIRKWLPSIRRIVVRVRVCVRARVRVCVRCEFVCGAVCQRPLF